MFGGDRMYLANRGVELRRGRHLGGWELDGGGRQG